MYDTGGSHSLPSIPILQNGLNLDPYYKLALDCANNFNKIEPCMRKYTVF